MIGSLLLPLVASCGHCRQPGKEVTRKRKVFHLCGCPVSWIPGPSLPSGLSSPAGRSCPRPISRAALGRGQGVLAKGRLLRTLVTLNPVLCPSVENTTHCEFAYLRDLLIR